LTGAIDDGFLPCNITKTGFGPLEMRAASTFDGTLTVNEGDLRIYHSSSLGSTNGNTVINGSAGGRLYLYGNLTIAEPLLLNGERNSGGTLIVGTGSNVLTGPITCINQVRVQGYNGPLVITGGVTADNNGLFVVNSGSVITFRNKPLNLGTRTFWQDSDGVSVLAVAGNIWGDTVCAGGGIRCEVPNALPPTAPLRLGIGSYRPDGVLNLNGYDQTVGRLSIGASLPGTRIVTSATPALLTVNQSDSSLSDARFTGAVSLLKLGAGNLTLTNAASSTAGNFAVSNGTLTVARDGTFGPNCPGVFVGGTGTLLLSNSVAIANSAAVWMPPAGTATAKINLAQAVDEKVGWLFFGDKMMRVGTYGSTASNAANKDNTHFAGSGMLTVLRDNSGTMLSIR
jgi:autotransporter-associated beta strand protein